MPLWAALTLLVAVLTIVADVVTQPNFVGLDFPSFYGACRAARQRVDFYDVNQLTQVVLRDGLHAPFPFISPPVFAYLFMPMAWLDPALAQRLWTLATALAFCAAALGATLGVRARSAPSTAGPLPWPLAVTLAMCLALALNFHNVVAVGQVNLFVLALMLPAMMWRAEDRHRAAFGLALAILVKTSPVLFLAILVAQGRRRLAGRTCAWIAILVGISLLLGAARAWGAYFRLLPQLAPGQNVPGLFPAAAVWNFSLAGLFARLAEDPARARRLANLVTALLVVPLLVAARRLRARDGTAGPKGDGDGDGDGDGARGLLLSACALMIAAAPLAYVHHAIFLFPGLFWWLAAGRAQPRASVAAVLALGIVAATDFPGLYGRLELSPDHWKWVSSINLYALLALYGVGLRDALRAGRQRGGVL